MIEAVRVGLITLTSWLALTETPPPPPPPPPPLPYVNLVDRDPVARAVAACESVGDVGGIPDYSAENPTSTASGAFQFLDGTFEWVTGLPGPTSAHPPEVQDRAFLDLWDEGRGKSHWNPSRYCWESTINRIEGKQS